MIGNRTRDLPTCSAVPQPTALPRVPLKIGNYLIILICHWKKRSIWNFRLKPKKFGLQNFYQSTCSENAWFLGHLCVGLPTNCTLQKAGDTTPSSRLCFINFVMRVWLYRDKHKCPFYRVPERSNIITHNACMCRDTPLTIAMVEDTIKGTHFFFIYTRYFAPVQTGPGVQSAPCAMVTGSLSRG